MKSQSAASAILQMEEVCRDIPGWSPIDQLYTLFAMVLMTSNLEGDILELGSWCGRSSVAMGLAARLCGNTRLRCVDLFPEKKDWHQNPDGTYSMTMTIDGTIVRAYHDQTVWQEPFERDIAPLYANHAGVLDIFNDSVRRYGLTNVISSHRGTLRSFLDSQATPQKFRLAFIDGDHGYEAVCKDIRLTDSVLCPGSWICFDDAFTSYQGVDRAIEKLIIANPGYELGQQMTRKLFVARKRLTS
jgi:predicted O-methyltransferase YrrM